MSVTDSPIHRLAEHVIRTSTDYPMPRRIQLLEDAVEVMPDGSDTIEIQRIISQLRAADKACREFSFINHSEQI